MWVFVDQIIEYSIFIMIFQDLDFWMLELLILSLLNKFMSYKIKIYRHQKLAMYLSIIPSLLKFGSIGLSFLDDKEVYYYNGLLEIYYIKKIYLIGVGIFLYIGLIILRSYANLNFKWYMDIKYISHFKILTAFGIIGTFCYFIICLISTFIKCNNWDFWPYLAKVQKDQEKYLDKFDIYFQNFKNFKERFFEILIVFAGILAFFLNKLSTLLVIKYLTPVHVIFSIPFRYLLQKVISISYSFTKTDKITKDIYKIYKLILDTLGDISSCIGFLIYLEIIVLKCYNYDYDIKNNIMKRGTKEYNIINESSDNNEIIDDNDGIKEVLVD